MTGFAMAMRPYAITHLVERLRQGSRPLFYSSLLMVAAMLACMATGLFDARLFNGINVWDKPAKFFLAVAVQEATIGWLMSYLPAATRSDRGIRIAVGLQIASGWAENLYIALRAARAEASHFNTSVTGQIAYGLMGLGALLLTGTAFYIGWHLWRHRRANLMAESASLGMMLGMVLTTIAGIAISGHGSHWVGATTSDAQGLGFFGWSTSGGDLRVAHFASMHLSQLVPFAALSGVRQVVYGTAVIGLAASVALFAMGLAGIPFLRF